ncbi:Uu.00g054510.m01.CDS01 [Anthostomella pinea]|uniref:Uu.00g054510.m01.CDS01 n=1 Tax=Anthostomella pinea TaxID=933095 RepID=A0AAI8VWN0_9PEZI|nr:Uu.00g054510.m01.CDS01 [Anthostomella pinea]
MPNHRWADVTASAEYERFRRPANAGQLQFSYNRPLDKIGSLSPDQYRQAIISYANFMLYECPFELQRLVWHCWLTVLYAKDSGDWNDPAIPSINQVDGDSDKLAVIRKSESEKKEAMNKWFLATKPASAGAQGEFVPNWDFLEKMHVRKRNTKSHYTDKELMDKFNKAQKQWQIEWQSDGTEAGKLRNQLTAALSKSFEITKVVCLGLGSLSSNKRDLRVRQHCLALSIRDLVLKSSSKACPVFVQDPGYSEQDKKVLKGHGMKILDGSLGKQEGFVEIDDSTFVLSIGATAPINTIVCDSSTPAAMLWKAYPALQKEFGLPPIPMMYGFKFPEGSMTKFQRSISMTSGGNSGKEKETTVEGVSPA